MPARICRLLSAPLLSVLSPHYWGLGGLLIPQNWGLGGLFLLCLPLAACAATTRNVPTTAYPTIQAGINAAVNGDTVLVADGTFTGPGNVDINFNGKNITVKSVNGASKTIIDCQQQGRGFYIHSGETNAIISGFTITEGFTTYSGSMHTGGNGGGISIDSSSVTIQNCTINSCRADEGGGIFITDSFTGNTNIISNCLVTNNTCTYHGGGIFDGNSGGNIRLTNCTFYGNSSGGGGGICNLTDSGTIGMVNCVLSGNTAGGGSAAQNITFDNGGTVSLTNCTITGNNATDGGAAVDNSNDSGGGPITLTNDIIYGNTGNEVQNESDAVTNPIVTYCDIKGGYAGTGNIDADPLFVHNPSVSQSPPYYGDLHLLPGSPCIGKGTHTGAPATDLDGVTRPNPPSMGAYEYVVPATPAAILGLNLTPYVVSKPGANVTATLTASGTFQSVVLTCDASQINGTPPIITLKQSTTPGIWTATFGTAFLAQEKVNPFTLTALATRPDGTTTKTTAKLRLDPNAPALDLEFGANVPSAKKGQTVVFSGSESNFSTVPADHTILQITLPLGIDYVSGSASGLVYNSGNRTLTYDGPLNGYQSLHGFSFKALVTTVAAHTTLNIPASLVSTGFASISQTVPLTINPSPVPVSIFVNAAGGYGLLDGTADLQSGSTSLTALLTPHLTETNLLGTRGFTIWMGCDESHTGAVTLSPGPNVIASALAAAHLIAPSTSPQYLASFKNNGDHVDLSVSLTPLATGANLFEFLIQEMATETNLPFPSLDTVVGSLNDFYSIGGVKSAVARFQPAPKNPITFSYAAYSAVGDMVNMNSADLDKLAQTVLKTFKGSDKVKAKLETAGAVNALLIKVYTLKNLLEMASDVLTYEIATGGKPMVVRFEASPLH